MAGFRFKHQDSASQIEIHAIHGLASGRGRAGWSIEQQADLQTVSRVRQAENPTGLELDRPEHVRCYANDSRIEIPTFE